MKSQKNLNFNAGVSYGLRGHLRLIEDNLDNHEEEKEFNINSLCLNLNNEVSKINKNLNEETKNSKEISKNKQVDKTVNSNRNKFNKIIGNKKINK